MLLQWLGHGTMWRGWHTFPQIPFLANFWLERVMRKILMRWKSWKGTSGHSEAGPHGHGPADWPHRCEAAAGSAAAEPARDLPSGSLTPVSGACVFSSVMKDCLLQNVAITDVRGNHSHECQSVLVGVPFSLAHDLLTPPRHMQRPRLEDMTNPNPTLDKPFLWHMCMRVS